MNEKRIMITSIVTLLFFVAVLFLMGREFLSDSGFGVWTGGWTQDTSQWMADPYSFSHVLHGIIFFWALLLFRKKLSIGVRFLVALLIEVGWEILENTPLIINRYRAATASLDYYGDSILNSFFDVVFCILGFWLAAKLPWKIMLVIVIAIELAMLATIRDNLTLNVLMLLWPIEAIKTWQSA